jgi:hypothetical protein
MSAPASSTQAAQAGLAIAAGSSLQTAWPTLDVQALDKSLPQFKTIVAGLVQKYGRASSTLAVGQYQRARGAAVRGNFTVRPAPPAPLDAVGTALDWATRGLYATEPDIAAAERAVVAAAEKLILDAGRRTIVDNVRRDPQAHGWARLTEPSPCYFCALLATRGAVYRSERTADFKAHDHCRCHPEPLFGPYQPPAQVQEWRDLYQSETTQGNSKRTQREWRRAFDAKYKPTGAATT